MMRVLIAAGAVAGGWGSACLALRWAMSGLMRPPHVRTNFRGAEVAGTAGVVLFVPLVFGALAAASGAFAGLGGLTAGLACAGAGAVMGLLGLLDDLRGGGPGGGFAGHLKALARGRVTTGLVKAVGGGLVGLAAAWAVGWTGAWILVAGAVVALTTNLVNLFDLRPGRASKVWLLGWAALLPTGLSDGVLAVTGAVAGGVWALLPSDLGERAMLGDTGANLLGAVLGVCAVASLGRIGLSILLGILVLLTAVSERFSFSRVIESSPPLRSLDRLGRLP